MSLEPRIEAVRAAYGLSSDDFWQIPQNRQWVCKHAALEVVAAKAKVEWQAPQIIQADSANGIAVLAVSGKLGDRLEWATGEASPKNNKNSYPWAMAEKRAKDRVVLKLVGIHGLVYSEDEADDFKRPANDAAPVSEPPRKENGKPEQGWREDGTRTSFALKKEQPELMADLDRELDECKTLLSLDKLKSAYREKATAEKWNKSFMNGMKELFDRREQAITEEIEAASDAERSTMPLSDTLKASLKQNPLMGG